MTFVVFVEKKTLHNNLNEQNIYLQRCSYNHAKYIRLDITQKFCCLWSWSQSTNRVLRVLQVCERTNVECSFLWLRLTSKETELSAWTLIIFKLFTGGNVHCSWYSKVQWTIWNQSHSIIVFLINHVAAKIKRTFDLNRGIGQHKKKLHPIRRVIHLMCIFFNNCQQYLFKSD